MGDSVDTTLKAGVSVLINAKITKQWPLAIQ